MKKKAQFYILAAVLLLAITFGLFTAKKTISSPEKTFNGIVDNYIREAPFAANSGNLNDFTLKFYDYALEKDSNFEMLYLYLSDDNVTAFSLVKSTIFINEYSLSFNQTANLTNTGTATVSIGTDQYVFNLTGSSLKAIFLSQKEGSRNVRLYQ